MKTKKLLFLMTILMVFSTTTILAQRGTCNSGETNAYIGINGIWTDDYSDALVRSIADVPIGAVVKVGSNPYIDQSANVASFSFAVSNDAGEPSITIDNSNIGSYPPAWEPTIPAAFFTAGAVVTIAMTITPGTNVPFGCTTPWTYTWTLTTATGCVAPAYAYSNTGSGWVNETVGNTTINLYNVPTSEITLGVDPKNNTTPAIWNGCGVATDTSTTELWFTPSFDVNGLCTITADYTDVCDVVTTYTFNLSANALGIETFEKAGFSMYPNPAKDILNINFKGDLDVTILNTSGQKVLSRSINGQDTFDVSKLSKGLYFVKLTSGKDVITKKFIKE